MAIDRVILDLDNTLFHTSNFKVALLGALKPLGVTDEAFWGTYRHARDPHHGACQYRFKNHVDLIAQRQPLDQAAALNALGEVLARSEEFLFRDSKDFLSRIISLGISSILLTRGDPEFQQAKIAASGIDKLVERIIVTEEPKINRISECLEGARGAVYMVDDHLDATLEIVRRYPNIVPILKRRPDLPPERYLGSRILNFKTLEEIRDYLTIVQATNPHYAGE
ncbi:HAD family hydrolase [Patescibacteria group bacterium]|nr:MAG: HAD family hydrolase [Patescibacteria group bacterium]